VTSLVAFAAGVVFGWVTADEAYGQVKYLRVWLEEHDASYVLCTKVNDVVTTTAGSEHQADELIAALPARAWRRLSGRLAADADRYPGPVVLARPVRRAGRGYWLVARRSIIDPGEIAYYVCYGPRCWIWRGSPVRGGGSRNASDLVLIDASTAGQYHDDAGGWDQLGAEVAQDGRGLRDGVL
jgi:hypothetical protein